MDDGSFDGLDDKHIRQDDGLVDGPDDGLEDGHDDRQTG